MKHTIQLASILMLASFLSFQAFSQATTSRSWAFDCIHIPKATTTNSRSAPVIVAVVDDAFRLSHKELKDFIYKNPLEIPDNQYDDDGNGYIDDTYGWDISDNDKNVAVLEGRDKEFFHGTYIASIITKVASLHYGKAAAKRIKIMPVKVLADQANRTYLKDGYKGIKYAMENGADIICLAWSGGNPSKEDLKIIQDAQEKGILIISSVGNFNEEKILNPAVIPEVLAVAGINQNFQKEKHSNYGMRVDLAAPAEMVMGAHPEKDNAYIHDNGTSASAALVTGCAAILLSKKERLKNSALKEALLNTVTPYNKDFSTYGGKMGAGVINLKNALDYLSTPSNRSTHYSALRPKGMMVIDADSRSKKWEIRPVGDYHGFYLKPDISGIKKPEKHLLRIIVKDTLWNEYKLSNLPPQLFVPSPFLTLTLPKNSLKKKELIQINYHGKTIDSTKLYCSDLRYLNLEKGAVTDGSGENNYANSCSCKWLINVPIGKRIKFTFEKMDTQPNVDFVYLVDGKTAIKENIIAKFSGQNQPPVVVSRTNEVLVWFVTDKTSTGQGWQFYYEVVE